MNVTRSALKLHLQASPIRYQFFFSRFNNTLRNPTSSSSLFNFKAKRVKTSKPQFEPEYFEDKRNLKDLWNFSNLENAFEKVGLLSGKKVYLFGCTEPQLVMHKQENKVICIPVVVAVVSPIPPSDKIGINSIQREAEEIIPMKQMKMDWVPCIPLEDRDNQLESHCFIDAAFVPAKFQHHNSPLIQD
ncbi:hypothetical protein KIW84_057111 [Lathyrus oleraceus]|uniref:Uncharacterized protein n=1 Tax=Pisum sativum TaxID=3888 RepID=A0A9D5ANE5_PEA|nr:hypothetical protein KIW84_057111 [Pisum sativum]